MEIEVGGNNIIKFEKYFALKGQKNIMYCQFSPNGELIYCDGACCDFLHARIGDNFLEALDQKERQRVKRHLSLFSPWAPLRPHVEIVDGKRIQWINRAHFEGGKLIKFDSIGWILEHNERKQNKGEL